MFKIIAFACLLGYANPLFAQTAPVPTDTATTTIAYEKSFYDFGTVAQGAVVKHIFLFTNTGNVPLVITKAKATCGCTVPTYPHDPIAPGGTGEISVDFNTAGKVGRQLKVITIVANTIPSETFVQVSGEVKVKRGRRSRN